MKEGKAYIGDEIVEGNKIICEFMGGKKFKVVWFYVGPDGFEHESGTHLKYHSSWDWLIPAIHKFRSLDIDSTKYKSWVQDIDDAVTDDYHIEYVFHTLVKAITWHNNQNKQS